MTKDDLIKHAERIRGSAIKNPVGALSEARQFLLTYGGANNQFYRKLDEVKTTYSYNVIQATVQQVLTSFIGYVQNDLLRSISLEREIQIETVSDYLSQAEDLLNDKQIHPAAPAVIIGASLEEFLRSWLIEIGFEIETIKNSLDSYAKELRKLNLLDKQELKDITAWGGLRNDAAHGHWGKVENRERISLMLAGVNHFIRIKSA